MKYLLQCRKVGDTLEKTVVWKDKKGVVLHRKSVTGLKGEAMTFAIDESYHEMVEKSARRRGRTEKAFPKRGKPPQVDPR